jgi:NADP-dependent 3-hydroxy acid dehydrogenase YdfG
VNVNLQDKVVVITGASSGFGELIARHCAAAGARVVLAARSAGQLEQLATELGAERALAVPTDVTDAAAVTHLVEATLDRFGHADVLVNNAGFGVLDRFVDASPADLREMLDVNLYGAVLCTQAFLPHMLRRRSGQVVLMASAAGLLGFINMAFYGATKHALVGVARSLMLELDGKGVRCALICPGVAETNFMKRAERSKYSRATRLVPWLTAEQVAVATMRAIERDLHGRLIIPWQARPLVTLGNTFPRLAYLVMRLVR